MVVNLSGSSCTQVAMLGYGSIGQTHALVGVNSVQGALSGVGEITQTTTGSESDLRTAAFALFTFSGRRS